MCETLKDAPYDYKADIWSLGEQCSSMYVRNSEVVDEFHSYFSLSDSGYCYELPVLIVTTLLLYKAVAG